MQKVQAELSLVRSPEFSRRLSGRFGKAFAMLPALQASINHGDRLPSGGTYKKKLSRSDHILEFLVSLRTANLKYIIKCIRIIKITSPTKKFKNN